MSKKQEEVGGEQQTIVDVTETPVQEPATEPAFVGELLLNGTVTLQAKTRDELAEMIDNIPAETRYSVGAIGYDSMTRTYSLQVDIVPSFNNE
jgi:hypothetical protein